MIFSFLKKEDSKTMHNLFNKNFGDGWSEEMLFDGFSKGNLNAIGAFSPSEELVAVVTFTASADGVDIADIVVDKNFRNLGIAKELLSLVDKETKAKGINKIFLEVRRSNKSAQNLYNKHGFTFIGIRPKYYKGVEDALLMRKDLKE